MRRFFPLLVLLAGCTSDRVPAESPARPTAAAADAARPRGIPPGTVVRGCPETFGASFDGGSEADGPLQLVEIVCVGVRSSNGAEPLLLAPDANRVVLWDGNATDMVEIAALDGTIRASVPNRVTFRDLVGISGQSGMPAESLAWRGDSEGLWSVRQQTGRPAGWALSGLRPIAIGLDGVISDLPELHHPAGPLDGLRWVGGEGRALAMFGGNGGYYRPEHEDPDPTLAMVDAARGRVLEALSVRSLDGIAERLGQGFGLGIALGDADAVILPDGRMRAVLSFKPWADRRPTPDGVDRRAHPVMQPGSWLFWTEGEAPRILSQPASPGRSTSFALSGDGETVLIPRELQPDGIQISCRVPPCPQPPPPTPVTGPIAELVDAATGRRLWSLSATASEFWSQYRPPAISPDGRLALIQLPASGLRRLIGLVRMADGRLLQTFWSTRTYTMPETFGFTADGRVWTANGYAFYFYRFDRR